MSLRKFSLGVGFALLCTAAIAQTPRFGAPASEAEISAWNTEISPDGAGLPPGQGTVAEGESVFAARCQACHGEKGAGRPNDALVGGFGTLATADKPAVKTVGSFWPYATTLFDYTRRAKPWNAPKTLADSEVYAVAAYILHLNDIIPADAVMNAQTLPKVMMPNRDGFTPFPRPAR